MASRKRCQRWLKSGTRRRLLRLLGGRNGLSRVLRVGALEHDDGNLPAVLPIQPRWRQRGGIQPPIQLRWRHRGGIQDQLQVRLGGGGGSWTRVRSSVLRALYERVRDFDLAWRRLPMGSASARRGDSPTPAP